MSGSIIVHLATKYGLPFRVVACYLDGPRQIQVDGELGYWGEWGSEQVKELLPRGPGGPSWALFVEEARSLNRWPETPPERTPQEAVVAALTKAEEALDAVSNLKNLTHISLMANRQAGGSWVVRSSWEVS